MLFTNSTTIVTIAIQETKEDLGIIAMIVELIQTQGMQWLVQEVGEIPLQAMQ
jgi:hypothetical protein|tara:strand:+ start:473 stop:631 length:159 start_codon:yes stop_codon:yes gene_type:complete